MHRISISIIGHATSLFLAVTFVLCVGFDLIFPQFAMNEHWRGMLPGFTWLSPGSFVLGLIESYAYGWYFALVWVPLHNFFLRRGGGSSQGA